MYFEDLKRVSEGSGAMQAQNLPDYQEIYVLKVVV